LNFTDVIGERGRPLRYIYFSCIAMLSVLAQMVDGQAVELQKLVPKNYLLRSPDRTFDLAAFQTYLAKSYRRP
jgi:hypothetical protein